MLLVAFLVGLVAVGGVLGAPPPLSVQDVDEFLHLIPVEKILNVVVDYLAFDHDVQEFVMYLHSPEFKKLIEEIDSQEEYIQFLNQLEESDFMAYKYVNVIHTLLGMPGLANPYKDRYPAPALTGGVAGMVNDIRALANKDQLHTFYENMLKTNPSFKVLVEQFNRQEFKNLLQKLNAMPQISALLTKLRLTDNE